MCGITGYIGKNIAKRKLVDKLKILEYRGYDSAGVAVFKGNDFEITKSIGNIKKLESTLNFDEESNCGIGHTRWATNGGVNQSNCHPHISFDKNWALVHNGIIENVDELKEKLKDIKFSSQTDTEIIAHLIAVQTGSNLQKISSAIKLLKGSWALAIINKNEKNKIYIAKNKNPLYFSKNEGEVFVASDPLCFASEAREYFSLKDGQIADLQIDKISVYDAFLQKVKPKSFKIFDGVEDISKNGYPHFMLKEIKETKTSLQNVFKTYSNYEILKNLNKEFFKNISKIKIIGCGTAYNSSLVGSSFFKNILKIECESCIASEFRYSNPLIDKNTLCIFVSQSGETADTIECLRLAKRKKCKIITLTNVAYSSLAKLSKTALPICAGREIAVASTKAYTCQVAVFYLLANWFLSLTKGLNIFESALNDILKISKKVDMFDLYQTKQIANSIKGKDKVFFLGRGDDYFTSLEASLKLKEITYINSNAYPTGELKHGYIALIEKDTPVFVFANSRKLAEKTINGINEIVSRGAKVHLISSIDFKEEQIKYVNSFIKIKAKNLKTSLYPLISIIFAQYLAYFTSVAKNLNPDQPRNLAKSVTVE